MKKKRHAGRGLEIGTCAVPKWLKPPGWHDIGPYKSQTCTEFTDRLQNSKYNPFPCLLLGVTCRQQKQHTFLNLHWIFLVTHGDRQKVMGQARLVFLLCVKFANVSSTGGAACFFCEMYVSVFYMQLKLR